MTDLQSWAADTAAGLRPLVENEMMKSWRDGMREGLAIAERMAAGVRAEVGGDVAIAALDGLIGALQQESRKVPATPR